MFLHVTSTEHDTVERVFEECMFYDDISLVGVQIPFTNPITKFIVTKFVTIFSAGRLRNQKRIPFS